MRARRPFAVVMLFGLGCLLSQSAAAQEKKPEPPKALDKATVEAWEKRGFKAVWMGVTLQPSRRNIKEWKVASAVDPKALEDAVPAFVPDRTVAANLNDLPPVNVPFGLVLTSGAAADGLKHLADLKNLTHLKLHGANLKPEQLKHLSGLKSLTHLDLGGNRKGITDGELAHLAGLTNLTYLDLSLNTVANEGLKHLADLKKLTHLNLWANFSFQGEGLRLLTGLTHLNLSESGITDVGLAQLAGLKNLTTLDLHANNRVKGDGVKHLARLTNLTTLDLTGTRVEAKALAHFTELRKLTTLGLSGGGVNDETLQALRVAGLLHALAPYATTAEGKRPTRPEEVDTLDLSGTGATPAAAKHLAGLTNLTTLKFRQFTLTDGTGEGLKDLAGLKKLTAVQLDASSVDDKTLQALHEAGLIHALAPWAAGAGGKRPEKPEDVVALILPSATKVTDDGLKYFAGFTNLTTLVIEVNAMTGEGLGHLAGCTKLSHLTFKSNLLKDAGVERMAGFGKLATLDLRAPRLTDDGLKPLGRLADLTTLTVGAQVKGDGLRHLAGCKNLTTINLASVWQTPDVVLKSLAEAGLLHALPEATTADGKRPAKPDDVASLDLSKRRVSDKGLESLAGLRNLTTLKLGSGQLTGEGLKHLAALKKLDSLEMHQFGITDSSLEGLRDAGLLHTLSRATGADGKRPSKPEDVVSLNLDNAKLTDKGLRFLFGLTNMTKLSLKNTQVTVAGVNTVKLALPQCEVVTK